MRSRTSPGASISRTSLPRAARHAYRALRAAGLEAAEARVRLIESAAVQLQALGDTSTADANLETLRRLPKADLAALAAKTYRLLELLERERFGDGPQHVH